MQLIILFYFSISTFRQYRSTPDDGSVRPKHIVIEK